MQNDDKPPKPNPRAQADLVLQIARKYRGRPFPRRKKTTPAVGLPSWLLNMFTNDDRSDILGMVEVAERDARAVYLDAKRRVEGAGGKWNMAPDADLGADAADFFPDEMMNFADIHREPPSDSKLVARQAQWIIGLCRLARSHPLSVAEAITIGHNIGVLRMVMRTWLVGKRP